jgi:phage repressor protein C with HTH and peptisase S24 domain
MGSQGDSSSTGVDGMTVGQRIRSAREARGWSQEDLASRAGTNQQTVDRLERGVTHHSRYLPSIADALSLTLSDVGIAASVRAEPITAIREPVLPLGPVDFPVHAAAQGGSRGELILSAEPVEWAPRPGILQRVADSYGVIIHGESMVPEFEPGDIVFVHPHLPPLRDVPCLFYREKYGEAQGLIKRLVRFTEDTWHVRQWNPPKGEEATFTLSRREWPRCHRIVGKYGRR